MEQLAIDNINNLINVNEDTDLIFNNKSITINTDNSTAYVNVNPSFSLYFTFHQLFNSPGLNKNYIRILNYSIDNLFNNKNFIKLIEEDLEIEEIMDDISIKLDLITEKYNNKICNRFYDNISDIMHTFNEQWEDLMKIVVKSLPHMYYSDDNDNDDDISCESSGDDESSSDEDSSKED